jgi:peptidoglycan/LPS O-acetylase OafA/YrhL
MVIRTVFGFLSLILAVFGWFWLVANFAAASAQWWNSLNSICAIFVAGIVAAIVGLRNRTTPASSWSMKSMAALGLLANVASAALLCLYDLLP